MIIVLISAYQENPKQLERLINQLEPVGPIVVMGDRTLPPYLPGVSVLRRQHFTHEREKRNALLTFAKLEFDPSHRDWFLSIDPDEQLLHGDMLPELLAQYDENLVAYPIPRVEPNGTIWCMPSKLFRGNALRYHYLDTHVSFGSYTWNLDAFEADPAHTLNPSARMTLIPGWPAITHYRSLRADRPTKEQREFYTDDGSALTREDVRAFPGILTIGAH